MRIEHDRRALAPDRSRRPRYKILSIRRQHVRGAGVTSRTWLAVLRLQFQQPQQLLMIMRVGVFDGAFAQRRRSIPHPQRFDIGGLLIRQMLIVLS